MHDQKLTRPFCLHPLLPRMMYVLASCMRGCLSWEATSRSQKTLPSLDPLIHPLFSKLESSTVFSRSVIHFMREEPPPAVAMCSSYTAKLFAAVYQNLTLHSLWNFVSIEPHPPSSCWEIFVATAYQASWSTIKPFSRSLLCLLYIFPLCAALNSESHCA